MKVKICYVFISVLLILSVFFFNKKESIYVCFENIQGFTFTEKIDRNSDIEKVEIRYDNDLSYKYWELKIDNSKQKKVPANKISIVNSQYWIINNLNGFGLGFDNKKLKKYKLYVIKYQDPGYDSVKIYPVSKILFVTE